MHIVPKRQQITSISFSSIIYSSSIHLYHKLIIKTILQVDMRHHNTIKYRMELPSPKQFFNDFKLLIEGE